MLETYECSIELKFELIDSFWLGLEGVKYLANTVNSFEYEVDDKQIENIISNDSIEIEIGSNSVIDILV